MATVTSILPPHIVSRLTDADFLLDRPQAAAFLGLSVPTLERWAAAGEGPPIRRLGKRVKYSLAALKAFRDGTSQAA